MLNAAQVIDLYLFSSFIKSPDYVPRSAVAAGAPEGSADVAAQVIDFQRLSGCSRHEAGATRDLAGLKASPRWFLRGVGVVQSWCYNVTNAAP
jgi:hypothetical protein